MRTSNYLLGTIKETPADAELISHQLMLRAGMIRKVSAGIYTWMPLGLRVLKKVEKIVREEMDKAGAQEILMPSVQPAELWEESGRLDLYGPELLKFGDRHERLFCYGPTHEEVVTDLARREIKSYKQLPMTLYQIQTKFRDEIRPRFGVMRAREFLMKDAYSFHIDQASLEQTYDQMYEVYSRIFSRMGLKYRAVLADSGAMGGKKTHEFHVLADSGESEIAYCDESDYAANVESAEYLVPKIKKSTSKNKMEIVDTPNQKTIDDIVNFLNAPIEKTVKTLIVHGKQTPLVALILRGDHVLNLIKAGNLPQIATPLTFATEAEIVEALGCHTGSIGPVNLSIPVIVDHSAAVITDFTCGANEDDKHYINVNWERDVKIEDVADLRNIIEGDICPDGKGALKIMRGIEVGQIFQLGKRYSESMNATVLNEEGKTIPMFMGCYGIGVSRTVAAAIEQNYDDKGIIWPDNIAPFQVALVPIMMNKSEKVREAAENLYKKLLEVGYEVLFDDRNERPGVMFADMELIGIPHRLVISEKGLEQGMIEYKHRRDEDSQQIKQNELLKFLEKNIK